MTLVPISVKEIQQTYSPHYELSRDFMLDKTILISLSFFIIAAEIRFLRKEKVKIQEDDQMWHWKAMNIAKNFLPDQSPLVQHILNSFKRHYGDNCIPSSRLKQRVSRGNKRSISKSPRNIDNKVQNRNSCRSPQLKSNNFQRIYTQKSPNRDYFVTFPDVHSPKQANQGKFPILKIQQRTEYKEQLTERAHHEKNSNKKISQIKSEPFLKNQNKKSKLENDISPAKEYGQEYPMLFNNLNDKHLTQMIDSNNEENFGNISPINQETVIINSFDLYGEQKKTKEKVRSEQEEKKSDKQQKRTQSSNREAHPKTGSARYGSSEREEVNFKK